LEIYKKFSNKISKKMNKIEYAFTMAKDMNDGVASIDYRLEYTKGKDKDTVQAVLEGEKPVTTLPWTTDAGYYSHYLSVSTLNVIAWGIAIIGWGIFISSF